MGLTKIKTQSQYYSKNKIPDILFWVGCAGSFDEKAIKITKLFAKLLINCKIDFSILGSEETCTGDPAKRAGNEFLFQMQAISNINTFNYYKIKKIVTTCPHCFNTLKNEYPQLGGRYQVLHYTEYLIELVRKKKLNIKTKNFNKKKITFHDPCYLGRANGEYNAPRELIKKTYSELLEMKRCKNKSLCCGAGGSQMFKESEKGNKEINIERIEEALSTPADIIATACPFCNIMLSDGLKNKKEQEKKILIKDIVELII